MGNAKVEALYKYIIIGLAGEGGETEGVLFVRSRLDEEDEEAGEEANPTA